MAAKSPLAKTNYLSKDYPTLREELLAKIPLITKGRWTNLQESDPGITLLELYGSMIDNLLFYMDMQGQNFNLETARDRADVIRLLRLIGYEINGVTAAIGTVTLKVSSSDTPIYPVTVTKGTQVSAQGLGKSIEFITQSTVTLSGPTDTKTIQVVQGITQTNSFISDGSPTQKFALPGTELDKKTVAVLVDSDLNDNDPGETWTLVSSFYKSNAEDKHFKVQIDENSKVFVVFGDGKFGAIPPNNAKVTMSIIRSIGADGNVGKNAITRVTSGVPLVKDAKNNKATLTVVSSSATSGGSDVETIEQAKQTALGLLYGLNRAMGRPDFVALMDSIPSVAKSISWGEAEEANPDYRLMNTVRCSFFVKQFSDMFYNPDSRASYRSLRDNQVRSLLTPRMPVGLRLSFIDPVLTGIFTSIQVGIDLNNFDPNLIIDQIKFNILDAYDIDNVNFGQDVRISNILSLVNSVEGVSWAKIVRLHTTPPSISPDPAPNPPLDLLLEKWKIPSFADTQTVADPTAPTTVATPHIQATAPISSFIGVNDITIINPDTQSDILTNAFTYFPGSNLNHITVTYSGVIDQPSPQGGIYGHPSPETDFTTFNSLE